MIAIKKYPSQLNGYTIAAICARVQQRTNGFNEDEAVILGFDLTRRFGKFVTAYMSLRTEDGEPPTEWVLGNYYEDLNRAMDNFLHRAALQPRLPSQQAWGAAKTDAPGRPTSELVDEAWRRMAEGI